MERDRLFGLVDEYTAFGDHRTGSDADHATTGWVAQELTDRGLTVEVDTYEFERWRARGHVTIDDEPVEHLALHGEWEGPVSGGPVLVTGYSVGFGGEQSFEAVAGAAQASGYTSAVLATEHPHGSLVGVNRAPGEETGFPIVLVPGREADRLDQTEGSRIRIDLTAETSPGTTANVLATTGGAGTPLLPTTPTTGRFGCAGERGTGLAVLLDLVERLDDRPLMVLSTAGHELQYDGLKRWVADRCLDVAAIVHVGADVATEAADGLGARALAATRVAFCAGSPEADRVDAALAPGGWSFVPEPDSWLGEGEVWSEFDLPLLSVTGAGPWFHTPEDTPSNSTSPESLAVCAAALGEAVEAFDTAARG
jgi:hypothetical protein